MFLLVCGAAPAAEPTTEEAKALTDAAATAYQGRNFQQATQLLEQALTVLRAKFGNEAPQTLRTMNNLVACYTAMRQIDKALALIPSIRAGSEKWRIQPGLVAEQQDDLASEFSDRYKAYASVYAMGQRLTEAFDLADLSKVHVLT